MKDDPQYREKVLSLIQRDWGDSYAPRNCSVLITVGATLNEYRADSWPVGYDSEFDMRSQNSFYKRTSEKKDRQKELLEEYLENRAQAKKQQLEMLNKKLQRWNWKEVDRLSHGTVRGRWQRLPMLMMQIL